MRMAKSMADTFVGLGGSCLGRYRHFKPSGSIPPNMEWARLNVFQRLTRQWDSLHPYNAAQAMKLAGDPDMHLLQREYEATLRELGLGRTRVRGRKFRWEALEDSFCA